MIWAIALVAVGLTFLAYNLGLITTGTLNVLWPSLLLLLGAYLLVMHSDESSKKKRGRKS